MSKEERNLVFVPARAGKPAHYLTEITLNYRRIRRFAGRTKEEARAYLAKLRIAAKEGRLEELINPRPSADTFGAYARALLNSAEWKAKRSAKRNETSLKSLNRAFKNTPLADISPGSVRKYITQRRDEGVSPAAINRELSLLKSTLYMAEFDKLIASNPIRGRAVKKLEEPPGREKTLLRLGIVDDFEKQRRLVECAAPYFRPILQLALVTGMRRGEILKMRWSDINFTLGTIRIPAENAKSKRERVVPIDAGLIAVLDSLPKNGDYVFMNTWTGERRKDVDGAFKAACERAGIPSGLKEGLVFHDIRHLAAYRLVKTTDIVTASKILGHTSIQMTMRYVHSTETDKRLAIEKSAEFLFQGRQKDVNAKNDPRRGDWARRALIN